MLSRLRAIDADPRTRTVLGTAIALLLMAGVIGLTGTAPAPTASARSVVGAAVARQLPDERAAAVKPVSAPAAAAPSEAVPDMVTVQGVGSVSGTPDVLLLSLSVNVRRSSVAAALDAANAATNKVIASLRKHGVAARDIRTTGLGVSTAYDYNNDKQTKVGYDARHSLTARLRGGSSKDGDTISAAATASGDDVSIEGLDFDLEGNDGMLVQARDRAFADAKAKAQQYAKLSGRSLGAVIGISEVSSTAPPPVYGGRSGAGTSTAMMPTPVEAGSQLVGVTVTVTWELRD
jgi:uncharacterized protein YggE